MKSFNANKEEAEFVPAATWASEEAVRRSRSVTLAWTIAGIAVLVAILLAIAIMVLTPLKTVETQTILVDRQTGFTTLIDPDQPIRVSPDSALSQSFLANYVQARETFSYDRVREDYRKVMIWSAPDVRARYADRMDADNAASPFSRFARGQGRDVRILSVLPQADGRATVRFETQTTGMPSVEAVGSRWIAELEYAYSDRPLSIEERLVNPLGFQVTAYQAVPEAIPTIPIIEPVAQ